MWREDLENINIVIQLGSQVKFVEGEYQLAPHTLLRTRASAILLAQNVVPHLIVCGGSNFGVRYTDTNIKPKADFSLPAFANSDYNRKSEAAVIKDYLVKTAHIDPSRILAEGLSATTEENALFTQIILRRRPMFTGTERIGVLTLLYHMEKAFPVWQRIFGDSVMPVFAENILAYHDLGNVYEICRYYSTPKGGKQYDVERIQRLLTAHESLAEMMAS